MSLIRARLPHPWLVSAAASSRSSLLSRPTAFMPSSFNRSCLAHNHGTSLGQLHNYSPTLPLTPRYTHRFASTSTAQHTSTAASQHASLTPPQPSAASSTNYAPPAAVLSVAPTSPHTFTPSSSPTPSTTPLATALSAEMSSLPAPPPPSPTASRLARPFITAMHDYPLALLLSLAVLEVSSFSLTNQLLLAGGVQFSSTFAWSYLISVPIRRSAIVKGVVGVPLGMVVSLLLPWFKEIRLTELRRKSVQPHTVHDSRCVSCCIDWLAE